MNRFLAVRLGTEPSSYPNLANVARAESDPRRTHRPRLGGTRSFCRAAQGRDASSDTLLRTRLMRLAVFMPPVLLALAGCQSTPNVPLPTVPYVDLGRFMGDWYVIASIPTIFEKGAHNAVESYRLDEDGTIATTFTYRDGAHDGPQKRYTPRGFILDHRSNAVWGMQFLWPIKADYRIAYLADDYGLTVIGRLARDYVWIMARTPSIPESDYTRMVNRVRDMGYDTTLIQRIPQRWNATKGQQ